MTIHWWNTDRLVERLADGRVSEQDAAYYAMVGVVLSTQAIYFATWFGGYGSWLLIYEFFVVAVISLIGVSECFKANGGANGADFLKRFSVICVPVGIKTALASAILGQLAYHGFPYVVTPETFRNPIFVFQLFSFAFAAAFTSIFYWRVTTHLSRLLRRCSNLAVPGDAAR